FRTTAHSKPLYGPADRSGGAQPQYLAARCATGEVDAEAVGGEAATQVGVALARVHRDPGGSVARAELDPVVADRVGPGPGRELVVAGGIQRVDSGQRAAGAETQFERV